MLKLAVQIWTVAHIDVPRLIGKIRNREEALATTEWALLVAGVAALAIATVAVIRTQTGAATKKITTGVDTGTSFTS